MPTPHKTPPHLPDLEQAHTSHPLSFMILIFLALCAGVCGGVGGMYYVVPGIFQELTNHINTQQAIHYETQPTKTEKPPYGQMEKVTAQLYKKGIPLGTAVSFSNDGWFVTSAALASDGLTVFLPDGTPEKVQHVVVDSASDTAFLKIKGNTPITRTADTDEFSLTSTYIVSVPGGGMVQTHPTGAFFVRSGVVHSADQYERVIPLDIPADSLAIGAPVFTEQGSLVGILSSRVTDKKMATLTPLAEVLSAYQLLAKEGTVVRPLLGISVNQSPGLVVDTATLSALLTVTDVVLKSPAAKAGIKKNDQILAVDGKEVGRLRTIADVIYTFKPGQKIAITLQDRIVTVELGRSSTGVLY